jgi:hypothetical protein
MSREWSDIMNEGCRAVGRSFRCKVYLLAGANAPVRYQVADAPK